MVHIGPNWSNMVQNGPKSTKKKTCPKGSGTNRSPDVVLLVYIKVLENIMMIIIFVAKYK